MLRCLVILCVAGAVLGAVAPPTSTEERNSMDTRQDLSVPSGQIHNADGRPRNPTLYDAAYNPGHKMARAGLGSERQLDMLRKKHARTCTHVSCRHEAHLCEERGYHAGLDNPLTGDPERVTWGGSDKKTPPSTDKTLCDGTRWTSVRVLHHCSNLAFKPHPNMQGRGHCRDQVCAAGALCAMEATGECTCVERTGHDDIEFCTDQDGPSCKSCEQGFTLQNNACVSDVDVAGIRTQLRQMLAEGNWSGAADCGCAGAGAATGCAGQQTIASAAVDGVNGATGAQVVASLEAAKAPGTQTFVCGKKSPGCECAAAKVRGAFNAAVNEAMSWL